MSYPNFLSLIGNTPLVELRHLSPKPGIRIFAKLEGQNPSGSVKDRIVQGMVQAAEQRGVLKPGQTIIEASTGNTGIALAMLGKQRAYPVRVVIPTGVAPSISDILELYGTQVTWCEPRAGLKGAIDLAQEMAAAEGAYYLGQFTDKVNVDVHYQTTGLEIANALPNADVFIAGIGTGGTIMGVGRRLREVNPSVKVIGVEPQLGERLQGLRSIEEGFVTRLLDLAQLDGRFQVDSRSALDAARAIVKAEGILAGVSSGAVLHVAFRIAKQMQKGNIVVMFSDGGWKYLPAKPWQDNSEAPHALDDTHWW